MVDYETNDLPAWLQKIRSNFQARVAHQFILHFNIHDYVYVSGEVPRSLRDHIAEFLEGEDFDFVLFYSQSAGLEFDDAESEGRFDEYLRHEAHLKEFVGDRRLPPEDALPLFEHLLLQEEPRTAVVIDYVEKLAPQTTSGMVIPRDITINIETLQRWALDQRIRGTNNIVLLLTDTLGQVAAAMHTPSSQCLPVRVDLPDRDKRLSYLEYLVGAGSAVGLAEFHTGGRADAPAEPNPGGRKPHFLVFPETGAQKLIGSGEVLRNDYGIVVELLLQGPPQLVGVDG